MPHIKIEHASFAYPNGFLAVDDLAMEIEKGKNIAIVGQNGAGKTTTVKMLNGLHRPTTGNIYIGDMNTKEYTTAQISRKVGYVFQNPDDQIFHATVSGEVEFGAKMLKFPKNKLNGLVDYALKLTGLTKYKEENPYNLPLSVRKFVTIAAIIAMDTEIMIFDEPTAGQDEDGNQRIADILKELQLKGKTLITITHDMEFVAENFSKVIVMSNKKMIAHGTPKEIFWNLEVLKQAMLKQPSISNICRKTGIGKGIISIDEAVAEIQKRRAGCQHHI